MWFAIAVGACTVSCTVVQLWGDEGGSGYWVVIATLCEWV